MNFTFSKCLGKCSKDSNSLELAKLLQEWIIFNSKGDKVRDIAFPSQSLLSLGGWDHCCLDGRFCIRQVSHKTISLSLARSLSLSLSLFLVLCQSDIAFLSLSTPVSNVQKILCVVGAVRTLGYSYRQYYRTDLVI